MNERYRWVLSALMHFYSNSCLFVELSYSRRDKIKKECSRIRYFEKCFLRIEQILFACLLYGFLFLDALRKIFESFREDGDVTHESFPFLLLFSNECAHVKLFFLQTSKNIIELHFVLAHTPTHRSLKAIILRTHEKCNIL